MPEEEEDAMKNVKFKDGKVFGDWKIGKVLDEGGFGMVYIATNIKDPKKIAALKAESNEVEGGSAIKLEIMILNKLNKNGPAPHIPMVYLSAKRRRYCYMVMTLLGPNLKSLKAKVAKNGFSRGTWCRLGIQCLYSLKYVHDNGFIHRDIKPQNFLMGNENDREKARVVHILDFGLARPFANYNERDKKWVVRKARGTAEFRGTVRYTSPNVHLKKEQGRGDDVWALLYVLIELNGGKMLPWQNASEREMVEQMKLNMSADVVMANMPACMCKVMPHLATLDYYMRPDYHLFFKALWQVMENEKVTPSSRYDWETDNPDKSVPPAAWEDPTGAFFSSDPIGVNGPPTAGDGMQPTEVKTDALKSLKEQETRKSSAAKGKKKK